MTGGPSGETRHPMAPIADRRKAPRLRSLLSGSIIFDDRNSTLDCVVRNISAWGAKIVLPDAHHVPEAFDLLIPHHAETHRAKVIWRKGENIGLALSDVEESETRH
jgi:PilZ domain